MGLNQGCVITVSHRPPSVGPFGNPNRRTYRADPQPARYLPSRRMPPRLASFASRQTGGRPRPAAAFFGGFARLSAASACARLLPSGK